MRILLRAMVPLDDSHLPVDLAIIGDRKLNTRIDSAGADGYARGGGTLVRAVAWCRSRRYNAYNYMVLGARARKEAHALIPAVIHYDGITRVQIVRPDIDPFMHAFLQAMGRRMGVEVAVNTSLNVGSPIVQTPDQAIDVLRRSKGLSGLLMIGSEGDAFLAWHTLVQTPKDGGRTLMSWLREWHHSTTSTPALAA